MGNFPSALDDTSRKAAVVEILTQAAAGGTQPTAVSRSQSGALSITDISDQLTGCSYVTTKRLVQELVTAGTIVIVSNGNQNSESWTYTIPE